MRLIGLHLRITDTIFSILHEALDLQLTTFQCFLLHQINNNYVRLSKNEREIFLGLRNKFFQKTFLHGSYWINLSNREYESNHYILRRELLLARDLGFNYLVLHAGSSTGWKTRQEGIECIARVLNKALKKDQGIDIILENTAHGGRALGSDFVELQEIRKRLDCPERVSFCIDTAHAYAYGYPITQTDSFIDILNTTLGLENISLLHLNDTKEEHGFKCDKHDMLGCGNIGIDILKKIALDERLSHIPVVMELPVSSRQDQISAIALVKSWHDR